MNNSLRYFATALLLAGAMVSCKKEPVKKAPPTNKFSLDKFEQNIKDTLRYNTTGFAYSISYKGNMVRSDAGGLAVTTADIGNGLGVPNMPDRRQDIASCSKTITALTLLSIMQEQNKSLNDSLANYIPAAWTVGGSSFRATTLQQLMRHESGFPAGNIGYSNLRNFATSFATFTRGTYAYQNHNYAWLRIVIAYMAHPQELAAVELACASPSAGFNHAKLDSAICNFYIAECNKRVFQPCGIPWSVPSSTVENTPTMNYNFNAPGPGWNKGDMTLFAGSAGWRLSVQHQNAIMAFLANTDKIINSTWRQRMYDNGLGFEEPWCTDVQGGKIFMHGGFFEDQFGPNQSPAPAGRGCYTVHAILPVQYECAIQVNSLGGTANMNRVLRWAYDNAWVFE